MLFWVVDEKISTIFYICQLIRKQEYYHPAAEFFSGFNAKIVFTRFKVVWYLFLFDTLLSVWLAWLNRRTGNRERSEGNSEDPRESQPPAKKWFQDVTPHKTTNYNFNIC